MYYSQKLHDLKNKLRTNPITYKCILFILISDCINVFINSINI